MEQQKEQRGNYMVTYYTVEITKDMKEKALEFAKAIILTDNQYSRLLPKEIRASHDVTLQKKIEIQRTYMGKLGELAFLQLLQEKGKKVNTDGMFTIFEGQENVDNFDFVTKSSATVDVKTGFRGIHQRLLVNTEQFDRIPKDYYVAVKVKARDVDEKEKLVDWDDITSSDIIGFSDHIYMSKNAGIRDFGEGPARWLYYNKLMGIDRLLEDF